MGAGSAAGSLTWNSMSNRIYYDRKRNLTDQQHNRPTWPGLEHHKESAKIENIKLKIAGLNEK